MNNPAAKPWIAAQNKALERGVKSLNQPELLALIGAPLPPPRLTPPELAVDDLLALKQGSIGEFSQQYGIGISLACKLAASSSSRVPLRAILIRRDFLPRPTGFRSPGSVYDQIMSDDLPTSSVPSPHGGFARLRFGLPAPPPAAV